MIKRSIKTVAMGLLALAWMAANVPQAAAATRTEIKRMIVEEASNSRVPPSLALAVAKVESDFQGNALSTAGARGVMQIMPATAQGEFGVHKDELWDPKLNVQLGVDYLERLYDRYGGRWDLALSHYNGGTLEGGSGSRAKPHAYTRKYVASVLKWHGRYVDQARVWRVAGGIVSEDGWRPARTKTRNNSDRHRIIVRRLRPRPGSGPSRAIVKSLDALSWAYTILTDFDDPDFAARLAAARRRLDDFASGYIRKQG